MLGIWLRSALFNLLFYGLTAAVAVLGLPLLALPPRVVRSYLRGYAGLTLLLLRRVCGIRLTVVGAEHLPAGGAALIACNHQSAMDALVWLWLLPAPAYVLKRELLRIPLWGWYATRAGMIAVDRAAGGAAMRQLMRDGKAAARAGQQIVIFPEGTRILPGRRVPFQPGVTALAVATGLPLVPAATDSGRCWGRRAFRKQPGIVTVGVLPPLPAERDRGALLARLEFVIGAAAAALPGNREAEAEPRTTVDKTVDDRVPLAGRAPY